MTAKHIYRVKVFYFSRHHHHHQQLIPKPVPRDRKTDDINSFSVFYSHKITFYVFMLLFYVHILLKFS